MGSESWGTEMMLSVEQIAVRNAALVRNLRFKFKAELETYSDSEIVIAFDDWFLYAEFVGDDHEEGFLEFLELNRQEEQK